ncbi:Leucine Rich Repeat family protein [Coccidioides posadasii C735 delta SOWgp]|uniref:Leucine Rich Repeat family protein n=1 Tax=Coccidioides posadasii (strain C735) TaxID=222929 RepID=C5P6X7_COCP7|nr:Leucine Rich Repeat family protein [Coccidioides posadasii C735 delta SOWgp]EER27177.1 Leucine Rich Repeat family protein [Coccidioides posadasii C735 delta SOWgp]|eukprot:XP_003069322.1 Leucine Rich Repeat family protein [Coccidioides posadasii C735 delta SOWgp]
MDGVDTVDVSWLHHSQKDNLVRTKSASSRPSPKATPLPLAPAAEGTPKPQQGGEVKDGTSPSSTAKSTPILVRQSSKSKKDKDAPTPIDTKPLPPSLTTPIPIGHKPSNARPTASRRNSWISNLSSKFSSGSTPPAQSHMKDAPSNSRLQAHSPRTESLNPFGAAYSPKDSEREIQSGSFGSHSPKNPSFFHNAFRKLASSGGGLGRTAAHGGSICERRVMNIDRDRDRCKIPELNQAKLRRVAFCVDVEIAGVSRRADSDEDIKSKAGKSQVNGTESSKSSQKKDAKVAEKAEGVALKAAQHTPPSPSLSGMDDTGPVQDGWGKSPAKEMTRKQEKKKKSEEERKERKERKRRLAEESGSVPLHFDMSDPGNSSSPHRFQRGQDQPTTDPVRIYRRCCQLRETGILKKLVEQISSPSSSLAESPGTVGVLDLTGFAMSFQDIVTFSDWLAIVPVRKLILQDCGLTDEAVRVILAGLLSTKTVEAARLARGSKRSKKTDRLVKEEKFGAIEKLSLKDNPKIGPEGWRHVSLFIHMSRSLRGIDLSGIPFPSPPPPSNSPTSVSRPTGPSASIATVFSRALAERLAKNRLEELVISECCPSTEDLEKICDAAKTIGLRRLGLANNNLTREGLRHVIKYFNAGHCEGLDLGGNDLNDHLDLLTAAFQKTIPLTALSLADCSLVPKTLANLLQALIVLPNFRFIDLSHNQELFTIQPDSLATLRRYLPKLPELRRVHLADVDLTSEKAIAIAEILPDCPKLCHISVLENSAIEALAAAKDATTQEEACALYASFMAAVRVSKTMIAVEIDVPTADNNEIVKALASQIVAYSLRNLERGELAEQLSSAADGQISEKDAVPIPDVLAHLVGHGDNEEANGTVDDANLAPDEDYVIGGSGVVKALGVCLGNTDYGGVEAIGDLSPPPSGASTPLRRLSHVRVNKKPRDMSKNLLNAARRIRVRLQPALVREDKAGNDLNYRRLLFLDGTLQRMIQRFEDEFPDTRLPAEMSSGTDAGPATEFSLPSSDQADKNSDVDEGAGLCQSPENGVIENDDADRYAVRLSRTSSNTSLHSRALTSEEGRVLRLGQRLSHDVLNSELDNGDGTISRSPPNIAELQKKLEQLRSSESDPQLALHMREGSYEGQSLRGLRSASLEDLVELQRHDPDALAEFKEDQIVALINAGIRSRGD